MRRRLARWAVPLAVLALTVGSSAGTARAVTAADVARPSAPPGWRIAIAEAAQSAASPGWRVTRVLDGVAVGGLWAGGPGDAWLAGDTSNGTVVVRHWNGHAWRTVTPPGAYINSSLDQGVAAVAATSAANAWVLAGRGSGSVQYTDALHWTGRRWTAPVQLDATIQSAVAPEKGQLWAFGQPEASGQAGYFAHYHSGTWTHGSFPVSGTAAAARSASDIWVGGDTARGLGIEHWNGHRWRATALPDLGLGSGSTLQDFADILGLVDLGLNDVWADIGVLNATGTNPPGTILLHWDGRNWSRVSFPYVGNAITSIASDGHGGIWLATAKGAGSDLVLWFDHYSGGRWTRVKVPSQRGEQPQLDNLAWIPGTRSLWGTGSVNFANNGEAILKYGA
jgi:hypothetical protein